MGKALLSVLGAFALASCGGHESPVSPTPTPGSSRPLSIAIRGATSLDHPGETGQLTAVATFSDNTSRDVTTEASWSSQYGVTISGPGVVTATRYGVGTVSASYLGVTATTEVRVAPAGAFLISGSVQAEGGFRLAQARVEFSSRCGTHSTLTDEVGDYVLPAEGEATMRVEREGFRAQVRQMIVGTDGRVDFALQPLEAAGDLSGAYRLTVSASPSCVLPPEVMQRHYDARVLDTGQDLSVLLSGATLVTWAGQPGFTGSRDQQTVRFVVRDTFDDGYNFIERIDGSAFTGRDLYYSGIAEGYSEQSRIVTSFNGTFELRSGLTILARCQATNHRFELTRSGGASSRASSRLLRQGR